MYNFSEDGLYFESIHALEPESRITIMMPNYAPETAGPEAFQSYLVEIRWCQDRSEQEKPRYGVGVRILEKVIHDPQTLNRRNVNPVICVEMCLIRQVSALWMDPSVSVQTAFNIWAICRKAILNPISSTF